MAALEHLTVALPVAVLARVRDHVRDGKFVDVSAAITDALLEVEVSDAIDAALPTLAEPQLEQWLRTVAVDSYDEMIRDPSGGMPIERFVARLKAERVARGE